MNQSDHSDPILQQIGKALGRVPSGVYILTARDGERSTAMLASWIVQAAFDPPAISVAVAKGRPMLDLIRASKRFAVSVIPDADKTLMKKYARGVKEGDDPFAGVQTIETPHKQIALPDALAWLECEMVSECDFNADHVLIVARVTHGALLREGTAFNHQRGSGFHY